MMQQFLRCVALSLSLCTPLAFAVEGNPMQQPGSVLAQTLVGLLLVVGLIFGFAFLARKLNLTQFGQTKGMKIIAGLSLSAREKVVLVQVGDKQVLLGVAPGNVNLLQVFDDPVLAPEAASSRTSSNAPDITSEFAQKLSEILKFGNKAQ